MICWERKGNWKQVERKKGNLRTESRRDESKINEMSEFKENKVSKKNLSLISKNR